MTRKPTVLIIDDLTEGVLKPYKTVMEKEFPEHNIAAVRSMEEAHTTLSDTNLSVDYMIVDGGFLEGGVRVSGTGQKLMKEVLGDPETNTPPKFIDSDPELHKRVIIAEDTATPIGSPKKQQAPDHKIKKFGALFGGVYEEAFGYTPNAGGYFQKAPQPFDREPTDEENAQVNGEFEKWRAENDPENKIQWTPENQSELTQHVARQMAQFFKQERRRANGEAPDPEINIAPRGMRLSLGENPAIDDLLNARFLVTVGEPKRGVA